MYFDVHPAGTFTSGIARPERLRGILLLFFAAAHRFTKMVPPGSANAATFAT